MLDTHDLGEAESVLKTNLAAIRICPSSDTDVTSMRIARASVGNLSLDATECGFDFEYEAQDLDRLVLCRVLSGGLESGISDRTPPTTLEPGQVGAFGISDRPRRRGRVQRGRYEQLLLDRRLLGAVACGAPRSAGLVELTASVPISDAANRQLFDLFAHIGQATELRSQGIGNQLLSNALEQYVATVLLSTIPNTALLEPDATDRRDSTPTLLRRAMAFIDDNAHREITLSDIAGSVYVTPRALQYMFRKHRDCTPTEYLRLVRLRHAHVDLAAGTRADTTVTTIAHRWGFAHVGRFAVYYRQHYGQSPHVTLRA